MIVVKKGIVSAFPKADLRHAMTMNFIKRFVSSSENILDLGTPNHLSELMKEKGYVVKNTVGEDFDSEFHKFTTCDFDCLTSFEVFEHLMAPYNLLKTIEPKNDKKEIKLLASVPLKVWFSNAYWNEEDEWDRHYHEFEPRQFDWLLKKTGWEILHKETWTSPATLKLGLRPLLRCVFPSFYFVYAVKRAKTSS